MHLKIRARKRLYFIFPVVLVLLILFISKDFIRQVLNELAWQRLFWKWNRLPRDHNLFQTTIKDGRDQPVVYEHHAYLTRSSLSSMTTVAPCYLDRSTQANFQPIAAYYDVTPAKSRPLFGSYELLGLSDILCFDRPGRFGPYRTADANSHKVDWSTISISMVQNDCYETNKHRFNPFGAGGLPSRTAFVLRAWEGYNYTQSARAFIRSLVAELSLSTGGEYHVYLLVEIKSTREPFWESPEMYKNLLSAAVPEEFHSMVFLWSEAYMEFIYPGPFEPQSMTSEGSVYRAHRSMHFALQWFAHVHNTYGYFWNWEMDIVWIGHWLDFVDSTARWARTQPRIGLNERNERFYIPSHHGSWDDFGKSTQVMHEQIPKHINMSRGVGEDADLLVFNPVFETNHTEYVWRDDYSGYSSSGPQPKRRSSIITAGRFSRCLLDHMYNLSLLERKTMASEMMPATVALDKGLKLVYVHHPVFFDRIIPSDLAVRLFNNGPRGSSGGYRDSPFSLERERPLQTGTYYYDATFGKGLWKAWNDDSLCLRQMLIHPAKHS